MEKYSCLFCWFFLSLPILKEYFESIFSTKSLSAQGFLMPKQFSSFSKKSAWTGQNKESSIFIAYLIFTEYPWYFSEHTTAASFQGQTAMFGKTLPASLVVLFCLFFLKTEKPKGVIYVIKFLFPHDQHCCKTTHDSNNSY